MTTYCSALNITRVPHAPIHLLSDTPAQRSRAARHAREENAEDARIIKRSLDAFIDRFDTPVGYSVEGDWETIRLFGDFNTEADREAFETRAGRLVANWKRKQGIDATIGPAYPLIEQLKAGIFTEEDLVLAYAQFTKFNNLPARGDALDLLAQNRTPYERAWLDAFVSCWDRTLG